jgi:TolB-like protein/Tfp pilus assembly protein PilF
MYEFGPYKLDAAERLLRRGDEIVPLTLKAFETLLVLVKNSGRIIEKEELLTAVWAESFVEEATLAQNVFTLRKTLGRDENGRSYIETIQRRGYRFVAPVRVVEKSDAAAAQRSQAGAQSRAAAAAGGKEHNAIAVLALDNACEDPSADYLSDGITESIINSLSRLPSLRVMSRSTILQYKGKGIAPQEVGRELGVPTVLTGRVLRLDSQMIIRVELVDVQHGWQIWGEQYSKEMSDIFRMQEDVANQITNRLRSKLTKAEEQQLALRTTQSAEAYELYLKGRYYWNKRSTEGYRRASEYFKKAIHIDPEFALAYSGYADARCLECVGFYGAQPAHVVMPEAKRAALKAIELNGNLPECHTSLAYIQFNYDWDWAGAEREFKSALELGDLAHTNHWYSHYLLSLGRDAEALAQSQLALELESFDPTINQNLGWYYLFTRQYDKAVEQLQATLDLHPDFYPAHIILGLAYVHSRQYDQAVATFQQAVKLEDLPPAVAFLGYGYAMAGAADKSKEVLDRLFEQSAEHYVSPYDIARMYVARGDKDAAFTWLQKAFEERNEWMTMLKVNPELDSLRDDPRFEVLLRRVGLA